MKNLINHPRLGGDVVEYGHRVPQRKPNKSMTAKELLNKAIYGTHKPKNEEEKRKEEWKRMLKK